MIKSGKCFTGIICIKMYLTGVGLVQPVGQEKCPTGKQKHQCDSTMSDIQWNASGLISVVLFQFLKRDTGVYWLFPAISQNGLMSYL